MSAQLLLSTLVGSGGVTTNYVDEVFSTYLYTGNGSTQTINNGIDLAGKGGLVWIKGRTGGVNAGATNHVLNDTVRGAGNQLVTNSVAVAVAGATFNSFNSNGFTVGSGTAYNDGTGGDANFVSWTFRKAPKFFDVVTYTGDGVAGRQIAHSLGVAPGMIIVKSTSINGSVWYVWHRSLSSGNLLNLNLTDAQYLFGSNFFGNNSSSVDPTSTVFTVGNNSGVNGGGFTYVAYLFANDTTADGIIQCGSFTTDASGNATVNLGWEPQYITLKVSSTTGNWITVDSMRGMPVGSNDQQIYLNLANAETSGTTLSPTAIGFDATSLVASQTYIYLAIRRPNKPPTTGTQVFKAFTRTGDGVNGRVINNVGFPPDLLICKDRGDQDNFIADRLRGTYWLGTSSVGGESGPPSYDRIRGFGQDGVTLGDASGSVNQSPRNYLDHFFRRAPGFFDEVCYTGNSSNRTLNHNLTVPPELWLIKSRSTSTQWVWGSNLLANTEKIVMPTVNGKVTDATAWNSTYPTSSVFSLGTSTDVNNNLVTYVGYFWATLPGISKVFYYTGNGTSQTINCGFSAGARFIMIIRTTASTAQDIYIWDSVRGIVAGNDPHLSLNTTAAEVTTDDSVDPDSSGFIVNQLAATNINVNGATYIGLAIA